MTAPPSGSSPAAEKLTVSGAGPEAGSANASTVGGVPVPPPWIVNVSVPTAPALPATSVARCSTVCWPVPVTVTGVA